MSIINDALAKAEKEKKDEVVVARVFSKRLIWMGAALACVLGILLISTSVNVPSRPELISNESVLLPQPVQAGQPKEKPALTAKPVSGFNLTGIVYENEGAMAIINERIVVPGDLVDGARVLEIQPNSVKLSLGGKELQLNLK